MIIKDLIYLDNASTTKVDDRVVQEMIPFMSELYGNANSSHKFGAHILKAVEDARVHVARLIYADTEEVYFSSGATESINTILKSVANANRRNTRNQIVTVVTEHSAVLDTCSFLEQEGIEVTYLPVKPNGLINIDSLRELINENTLLVCVMLVNNETGVIQPIKEISAIAHEVGALMMSDATQAIGKINVDVKDLDLDFMVFSGHKFYGPKGIGGMFIKKSIKNVTALIHGGNHERGKRSGTLNVPGIIGLGKASKIAEEEMKYNEHNILALRNLLESELLKIPESVVNGTTEYRIYNISNIHFPNLEAEILIKRLENICISNGSACTSNLILPSHVLKSMGKDDQISFSSIRLSLGKFNTKEEILHSITIMKKLISELSSVKYV